MVKHGKHITKCNDVHLYLQTLETYLTSRGKAYHTFIDDIETQVRDNFKRINEQTFILENLTSNYYHLIEYSAVLRKFKEKVIDQRILA